MVMLAMKELLLENKLDAVKYSLQRKGQVTNIPN